MKKLNRKGYTLIELLAVIVILAVVLVVTIPSVISSMNTAKGKQLKNSADSITEWFTKQYELATLGSDMVGTPDAAYTTFVNSLTDKKLPASASGAATMSVEVLKAAGLTDTHNIEGKVYLNGNKICIKLKAKNGSQFFNSSVSEDDPKNNVEGSGCPIAN